MWILDIVLAPATWICCDHGHEVSLVDLADILSVHVCCGCSSPDSAVALQELQALCCCFFSCCFMCYYSLFCIGHYVLGLLLIFCLSLLLLPQSSWNSELLSSQADAVKMLKYTIVSFWEWIMPAIPHPPTPHQVPEFRQITRSIRYNPPSAWRL